MRYFLLVWFSILPLISIGSSQSQRGGRHRGEPMEQWQHANTVVRGEVVSKREGDPLPFVNVIVKSKNRHAYTDDQGGFFIHAHSSDTLIISTLGYRTIELAADIVNPMKILLESTDYGMKEVVVSTALGLKRSSRELGSSTDIVSSKELLQGSPVNPLTGLTGRVAGLRVNMYDSKVDPTIQVTMRGARSITGNNAPLYVLDGIPVPDIDRINPNDIEDITILKGANAAALYGSEGVNGALIITTKSGSSKGTITLKNTTSFSKVFLLPEMQTDYGQGIDGVYSPSEFRSWGPAFDGSTVDFGLMLPNGVQPQVEYSAPSSDMRKDFFGTGMSVQNDLSYSRRGENSSYFVSLQNVTVKGIIPKDKSSRNGIRFNSNQNYGRLRIGANLNYSYTKTDVTPDGPWVSIYQMPANYPLSQMESWREINSWGNPENHFVVNTSSQLPNNPYFLIDSKRNISEQQVFNAKIEAEVEIASWLKAMYRLGLYSNGVQTRSSVEKNESNRAGASLTGSVTDGSDNFRRLNGDLIITANKEFGKFRVSATLGQNFRDDYRKSINLGASNLLFGDLYNQGSRTGNLTGASEITQERHLAVYGEITAGYNNYLFLTLTGRNDWTSLLNSDNRSFFYPGISASFILSDAVAALKGSKVVNYAKLYASYNKTGNVNLSPYSLNLAYTQMNGFPYGNLVGFSPSRINPNKNIEPEFVQSYEVGMQWSLFDSRLNADLTYVYSNSKGQIFTATTSAATGYTSALVNLGELSNNIIELTLDGNIISSRDWRWNIGINYSYVANKVEDLYGSGEAEEYNIFRQSYAIKGESYPSLKVTDYQRDPNGRIVVDGVTGLPTAAIEPTLKGPMVPPHQIGLNTMLTYKGFTLYADFDCRLGGWMYSEVANLMIERGTHPMTVAHGRQEFVIPNSVIKTSDATGSTIYTPNSSVVAQGSDKSAYWSKYVSNYSVNYAAPGDYLKMRTLSLKYTLPRELLRKTNFLKEVTVGFEATNLFVILHKDNTFGDPEYLYNNTSGYYSWRQVPPFRTFGFSVNVAF